MNVTGAKKKILMQKKIIQRYAPKVWRDELFAELNTGYWFEKKEQPSYSRRTKNLLWVNVGQMATGNKIFIMYLGNSPRNPARNALLF